MATRLDEPRGRSLEEDTVIRADTVTPQQTCLVTGANSGIGRAIATGLAEQGARVIMVCRDRGRGEAARKAIRAATGNPAVDLLLADLSRQREIRRLSDQIHDRNDRLDVLVNNAGLISRRRQVTEDGLELQLAVNHLAYFLLTHLLLDLLRAGAPARIINVASTGHSRGRIEFDNLQGEKRYRAWQTYMNTKLANVLFTYELARRLEGSGVTANCVGPGVTFSGLMRRYSRALDLLWKLLHRFFKPPELSADNPVYLATAPEMKAVTGRYFRYRKPVGTSERSYDRQLQRRLWQVSADLTGVDPEALGRSADGD